jgi:hypothetical protein
MPTRELVQHFIVMQKPMRQPKYEVCSTWIDERNEIQIGDAVAQPFRIRTNQRDGAHGGLILGERLEFGDSPKVRGGCALS